MRGQYLKGEGYDTGMEGIRRPARGQGWDSGQHLTGIRIYLRVKDLLRKGGFNEFARTHDGDARRHLRDRLEGPGSEQKAC